MLMTAALSHTTNVPNHYLERGGRVDFNLAGCLDPYGPFYWLRLKAVIKYGQYTLDDDSLSLACCYT